MKQKKKSSETMVCSKRRQKIDSVITAKHNHEKAKTETEANNKFSKGNLENIFNGSENVKNDFIIIPEEYKSTEKISEELDDHKTSPRISELGDCTKNDEIEVFPTECLSSENSNDFSQNELKDKIDTIQDIPEEQVVENSEVERMPSPSSAKTITGSRTNHLTTIVENVKGEQKEVNCLPSNESKVQTDKVSTNKICPSKTTDHITKYQSSQRMEKGSAVNSSNMDPVVVKKTKEANEQTRIDRLTNRQPSSSSLKLERNEKQHGEPSCRPSSSKTDPDSARRSSGSSNRTRKIYSGIRFTKQELEYYLPRRSNFSCHEKALKDAGLDLEDIESKRKRRFRRARISVEDSDIDFKLKSIEDANIAPEIDISHDNESELNYLEDEQTEMERSKLDKSKRKGKKRGDETEVKVDPTVLLQYLKYVLENQEEYLSHKKQLLHQNTSLLNIDPSCTIARFGRIFQRGQHGIMAETFLLEVVHGIKSNYGDSSHWVSPAKDKLGMAVGNVIKVEQTETNIDEKDKTEYEKVKSKLDKWLKTITTAQLLKAKELALKELGEEDKLQTKWWATLQPCRYLRQRTTLN